MASNDIKITIKLTPDQCKAAHRLYARQMLIDAGEKMPGEAVFLGKSNDTYLKDNVPVEPDFSYVLVAVER